MSFVTPVRLLLALATAATMGCAKPDLTIRDLEVRSCSGSRIDYRFEVVNRDYGGNLLIRPGSVSRDFTVQGFVSSTRSLNQNDFAERPAGGVAMAGQFGPDGRFTPGESIERSVQFGPSGNDFDLNSTPFLVVKVDPKDYFDPESTTAGVINEYSESNNVASVAIGSCN